MVASFQILQQVQLSSVSYLLNRMNVAERPRQLMNVIVITQAWYNVRGSSVSHPMFEWTFDFRLHSVEVGVYCPKKMVWRITKPWAWKPRCCKVLWITNISCVSTIQWRNRESDDFIIAWTPERSDIKRKVTYLVSWSSFAKENCLAARQQEQVVEKIKDFTAWLMDGGNNCATISGQVLQRRHHKISRGTAQKPPGDYYSVMWKCDKTILQT